MSMRQLVVLGDALVDVMRGHTARSTAMHMTIADQLVACRTRDGHALAALLVS